MSIENLPDNHEAINYELLDSTMQMIKGNPKHWNQNTWHCGTTHCFAGFVELQVLGQPLTTDNLTVDQTEEYAREALSLTSEQSWFLFHEDNTLEDLEACIAALKGDFSKLTPRAACNYAIHPARGRFEEGETVIAKDAYQSYKYAKYVLEDRFEAGETVIKSDEGTLFLYTLFLESKNIETI